MSSTLLLNTIEYPVINQNYVGIPNCFVYGWVSMDQWRNVLVKKDLCDSRNDKTWSRPSHYSGEMWFIPRPGFKLENNVSCKNVFVFQEPLLRTMAWF